MWLFVYTFNTFCILNEIIVLPVHSPQASITNIMQVNITASVNMKKRKQKTVVDFFLALLNFENSCSRNLEQQWRQISWHIVQSFFFSFFLDAPKHADVSLSHVEIVEGDSVHLTCSSDGNPTPSYSWYKDNQVMLQGQGGVYQFSSVTSEDSGTYCCEVGNIYGRINSSSVLINVECKYTISSVWIFVKTFTEEPNLYDGWLYQTPNNQQHFKGDL